MAEEMKINGERLWASLMEMAKIGATPKGGVCRLTLTDLDKQGRDLVHAGAMQAETREQAECRMQHGAALVLDRRGSFLSGRQRLAPWGFGAPVSHRGGRSRARRLGVCPYGQTGTGVACLADRWTHAASGCINRSSLNHAGAHHG